jgi:site-specific recombinase XerD
LLCVCDTVCDGNFDKPKTKRSAQTIAIGTEATEFLATICLFVVDAKAAVFATREGLPRDLSRKNLMPTEKKIGLPSATWHLLRHGHATMPDSVGTPLGTMQSLLGH